MRFSCSEVSLRRPKDLPNQVSNSETVGTYIRLNITHGKHEQGLHKPGRGMQTSSTQPAAQDTSIWESEEHFALNAALLQSVTDSIAALFPSCVNQAAPSSCPCFFCRSQRHPSSTSGALTHEENLPPPSRYARRTRRMVLPPKGPAVDASKDCVPGPTDNGLSTKNFDH